MGWFDWPAIDRRRFAAGALGGLGLALSLAARGQAPATGFTHGVASGEPGPRSVLLWTRFVANQDETLHVELSETADFARVIGEAEAVASEERDWCAKATVDGLEPGRWYYYRFRSAWGLVSPVGRTRTLPAGRTERFRMAVFSCSNIGFGWFNAYAHAAADEPFDLVVHTGDYLYEYERGNYPRETEALAERIAELGGEIVALADYRRRHALYRADPDLQRLFQLQPWVMMWDDHENANDSWKDGAGNHQPATEGPWPARVAASLRAYREWLPVSEAHWAAYEIGDLATLFRLETRLTARDQQVTFAQLTEGVAPDRVAATLAGYRTGAWRDSARTLMGAEQEAWLTHGLRASRHAGRTWQVLAQQVVMGEMFLPPEIAEGLPSALPEADRRRIANRVTATRERLPFNLDAWDGYPAARERVLSAARAADANLIVLAGDSHNAWANALAAGGEPAGIEFAGTSVSSPGFERSLPWIAPDHLAAGLVAASPGLKWCDTARRGYMAIELTPARATCEHRFLATVKTRSTRLSGTHTVATLAGTNRFT